MFKEKTSKKRIAVTNNAKDASTLDDMHNNMIKVFVSKIDETTLLKQELADFINTRARIKKEIEDMFPSIDTINTDYYNNLWSSNIKLSEEIKRLDSEIQQNQEEFNELDYYKNTSEILFNYYDLLEKQSKIKPDTTKATISSVPKFATKTILDALNNTSEQQEEALPDSNYATFQNSGIGKSDLVDEYLIITNKQHVRKNDVDDIEQCIICKKQMVCLQYDAIMICESCGYQELLLVEQNRPILKQNSKDTSHFSYKRINHFREWCNQVQGKESTDIPNEIFEKILNEIKKEKISDTKTITYTKMREILKRLRINKYYEHINYIINRINGVPTPQFSPDLEDKLYTMFRDIQAPFLKHCPKDRKNFLSYSYVLYKFFQILGLNEYLKYFPLLKSREKLYIQDQIWKKICEDLKYEFHQSPLL